MPKKRCNHRNVVTAIVTAALVILTALPVFAQSTAGGRSRTRNFEVTIIANVPGARVTVDDVASPPGVPVIVSLAPGMHAFEVSADGYFPWTQQKDIQGAQTINASLQPVTYQLTVQSNVPAQVLLGGKDSGQTTFQQQLGPGNYNVTVRAAGYYDFTTTVNLNQNQTVNAQLQPVTYQLTVQSNVPAQVLLGGKDSGQTTYQQQLSPGSYNITVRAAGYIDFTTTVNMSENRTINAQLQPANARARISIPQAQLDDTNPGALNMVTVFVDGRPQVGSPFEIPPGRHTVRVRNGGMVVDIVQDFQPGRSYVIVPNFSATIQAD